MAKMLLSPHLQDWISTIMWKEVYGKTEPSRLIFGDRWTEEHPQVGRVDLREARKVIMGFRGL